MERILKRCAGIDVHSKLIVVCVLRLLGNGQLENIKREFRTMTRDLLALGDWLEQLGVTHVAMESTGVFWKPVYNLLEGRFRVILANARHIKQVPGRKTDVKDSEWIAQLLMHGLINPSFVGERPLRELRDLTRHRSQLVSEKTREANRIHKVLEDANIKLGTVASDILGVSGREMIRSIIKGQQNPEQLAELARRKLRAKIPELRLALEGRVSDHHRFLLKMHLEHVEYLEQQIEQLTERIESHLKEHSSTPDAAWPGSGVQEDGLQQQRNAQGCEAEPAQVLPPMSFTEAVEFLDEIAGIDQTAAQCIAAEIGTDMGRFPSDGHLSSWAGMCPGNNESAGKRKNGKTTKGSRWLRAVLCQSAWAATRDKDSYFCALYHRLVPRRGKRRALVAVGHAILVTIYHVLKYHTHYKDLGADWFNRLNPEKLTVYLVKRLEALGHRVILEKPISAQEALV